MNQKFYSLMLLFALLLSSCATHRKIIRHGRIANELFPNGTYVHDVHIEISKKEHFDFTGIVKTDKDAIRISALSPVGTTIFRLQEDRTSETINVDIFYDPIKKHKNRLKELYKALRKMFTVDLHQIKDPAHSKYGSAGKLEEISYTLSGKPIRMQFLDYDDYDIPERILIIHPTFSGHIKVIRYEI